MAAKKHPDHYRLVLRFASDPKLLVDLKGAAKKAQRPVASFARDLIKRAVQAA